MAAAVPGLACSVTAMQPPCLTVAAGHPFAFAIVQKANAVLLFIGQVADPSAA